MTSGGQAGPLITFHAAGGRTFQRIFRDVSLAETKEAVRLKLKLPVGEDIRLTRIESGAHIDLDDDDDFDAFRVTTRSKAAVDIAVTVGHSSLAAGASIPAGVAAAGLPQWDSASALALSRKRKRDRLSIVPGNGPISSAITTTLHAKPAAAGASTSHAAIDHAPPALSAQRTDFDAAPPRKRRKKLKFRDMPTVDRSASNPPASYVPPTPDSLASGPCLPLVHDNESVADTPAQASRPVVPDLAPPVHLGGLARPETTPRRVPPAMSPAGRDALLKKLKGGQGNAGSSALAMSSPSKAAPDALDTGSEVKKVKSKKGKEVEREIADTREEAPMPAETSRKPKKEKHARAVEQVDDQPSMVLRPKAAVEDEPPVHVPAKEKKSKTKRKDIEGDEHAEASAVTNSTPEAHEADDTSAVPVKTEKKTKKKRKTETEPEHTDVHIAPQPAVGASETSEKRKSKKRRKEAEVAGEPDDQATPKAALEPIVAGDALATSSTVDKKGKKRKKEADAESVKPAHAASTSHTPAAASNGFDQEKAVADAVAAIRARHSKSVKLAESEGLSGTPQSVREELTPAPVAGPSTMAVDPPAKEKRKSKKASTTNASSESMTPPADPVPAPKPKGKKRKGDGSTAESGPAPPSALSEAHISEMWNAVKAAAFATLNRGPPALPTPPAAAEQPASVPLPEAPPEVVPDAPVKVKKPKKEKAAKSKAAVPEVIEAADVELVEDARPDSPATASATAVERPQSKREGKSKDREDSRATEVEVDAAKDIDMLEEQPKKPSLEADAASHASLRASPRMTSPLPQDVQMSSPPRPPAGSNVDEIVIEGHGEGSSGESSSSSDTEDEDEDKDEDNAAVPDLSLVDVEALLRGPASRKSILEVLPSDSEEEDEDSGDEEQSEPGDDEEKEIELDKKYRRLSKRFQRESSSSDEEPEPEPEVDPQPEQEPDATQEEEEQEVVAATFMDVDPQETLEEEVDPKVPLAIVSASRASIPDDGDVPMAAPGDEEPLGTMQQSSQPPDEVHDPARPISPTVSMMGEDHRRDGSQDNSAQSLAQIEEQLTQVSLRSGTPKIDKASSSVTPPATSSEPKSTGSGTKRKPSPITRPRGGELEDDPIEPADDLIVPESPSTDMIDLIEPDPEPNAFPAGPERRQSTPPPLPISRPGTVRRMKNRDGKLGTPRPVKASELPIPALNIPSFAELDFEELLAPSPPQTQTKARVTRRTSSAASTAPPPDPKPAPAPRPTPTPTSTLAPAPTPALATEPPAPKRRGRPRLSPEEKERRAAERQAKKDAEKAEKLRLRLERAAAMAAKRVAGRGGRGAKAKAALEVESEDDGEGARAEREGKAPVTATPRPGWTTLTQTQTPRTQEDSLLEESMMVDELRSSSPEHPSPRAEEPEHAPRTLAARAMPPPSIKKGELPSAAGSQPETPAQHPGADPLFLPSSSQVPYTPYALAQPQPRRGGAGESAGESGSEPDDDEPIAQTQLQRARPWLLNAPFPRLSVLSSQAFFTPSSAFALTPVATKDATRGSEKNSEQHEDSDDEDDEDDDSDDDDEEGKTSHIPQERRAGASVQKKRVSGLASFAK